MKKIAVTGGLASGKTTVCHLLEQHGAFFISSDEIVHQLYQVESEIGKKITGLLGSDVAAEGVFNRKKIADKVFNDECLLRELEQILHPEVKKVIEAKYREVTKNQMYSLFVVEVPLLFESGWKTLFDKTIVVVADEKICRGRHGNEIEFDRRDKHLMDSLEKAKLGDIVVYNNGTLSDLKREVRKIFQQLI